jgi:hypothetical protein
MENGLVVWGYLWRYKLDYDVRSAYRAGAIHFPPDAQVTWRSNSVTACHNVSIPHTWLWAARGRLPLLFQALTFQRSAPWFTTTQLFHTVFNRLKLHQSLNKGADVTASQFKFSGVPNLTWHTATIHGNMSSLYMKEGGRSRCIAPLLNFGTIWRWLVKLGAPPSLLLRKEPRGTYYRLAWPQSRSRCDGKGKDTLTVLGIGIQ